MWLNNHRVKYTPGRETCQEESVLAGQMYDLLVVFSTGGNEYDEKNRL